MKKKAIQRAANFLRNVYYSSQSKEIEVGIIAAEEKEDVDFFINSLNVLINACEEYKNQLKEVKAK